MGQTETIIWWMSCLRWPRQTSVYEIAHPPNNYVDSATRILPFTQVTEKQSYFLEVRHARTSSSPDRDNRTGALSDSRCAWQGWIRCGLSGEGSACQAESVCPQRAD